MAKNIERRDFLKIGVATAGTLALSGGLRLAEAAKEKKLTFWQPIDNHYDAFEYFGSKISQFNQKYPDIKVDLVEYPFVGFEAKFLSAFAGRRNAPDVMRRIVFRGIECRKIFLNNGGNRGLVGKGKEPMLFLACVRTGPDPCISGLKIGDEYSWCGIFG